ncbi:MAG TPA: hypothetical protein VGF16_16085 [Bryobacteraceae bacterium]|jgi:hypothetical protein
MMHDPFQTYATLGAYSGVTNPLQLLTGGISPFAQQQGIGGYGGIHPQQLQLATMLAHATNPQILGLTGGLQNPIGSIGQQNPAVQALQHQLVQQSLQNQLVQQALQNPLISQVLQNPLVSQSLQNPLLNPIVSQYYQSQYPQIGIGGQSPFGQTGSPFGQTGSPFGQLAPQSWIGQQGFGGGSPFGYGHPLLSQWGGGRGIQGHGITPWSGF